MIDFKLTDEQLAMQKMTKDFVEKEMRPVAPLIDRDPEHKFNWDIMRKVAQNDYLRMAIPEKYGGLGLDRVTQAVVFEELATGCAGITIATIGTTIVAVPIATFGTEEQKEKFLTTLANKDEPRLCAFALTEPGAGSDVASLQTTARLDGDQWVINGTKCFITNAGVASLYLLFATIDKEKGAKGQGAFLIPSDAPGLSIGKIEDKMGQRAAQNAEVILEDVRIPKENILGKPGDGFKIMLKSLDEARPLYTGAIAVGLSRAAYETALKYAKERIQFGTPIFKQQAVSFKLVDMAAMIDAARFLVWKACWLLENSAPASKEAAMAKFFCADAAMKITTDAVQILGGYGYTKDFPVEKYMRDAKIFQIFEGTNEIMHVIAAPQL